MNKTTMCPHLKEVVMLYCDACPMHKLVPRDHLVSLGPCAWQDFSQCPIYREFTGERNGSTAPAPATPASAETEEVSS